MLTLIAAITTAPGQTPVGAPYHPAGPKIECKMANGGRFVITTDPKRSPKTVAHILNLVRRKFYDGQRVHRVEWWVTQWGAPASRNEPLDIRGKDGQLTQNERVGDGGSGKDIPGFEGSQDVDFMRGVVGIASNGLQLPGDSQLFIIKRDALRLWNSYAVVGKVTEGMDAVGRIQRGDRIKYMRIIPAKGRREAAGNLSVVAR